MEKLTHIELLDIIVALDNQACNCDTSEEAQKYRNLKWKLFDQLVKLEKEAA